MARHLAASVGGGAASEMVGYGRSHGGALLGLCISGVVFLAVVGMIALVCGDSASSTPTSSKPKKTRSTKFTSDPNPGFGYAATAGAHYGGGHHGGSGYGGSAPTPTYKDKKKTSTSIATTTSMAKFTPDPNVGFDYAAAAIAAVTANVGGGGHHGGGGFGGGGHHNHGGGGHHNHGGGGCGGGF